MYGTVGMERKRDWSGYKRYKALRKMGKERGGAGAWWVGVGNSPPAKRSPAPGSKCSSTTRWAPDLFRGALKTRKTPARRVTPTIYTTLVFSLQNWVQVLINSLIELLGSPHNCNANEVT